MAGMTLKDLAPSVTFGTSGLRALARDITPQATVAYTRAFVRVARMERRTIQGCVLGWDLRPSSPDIAAAVCAGLEAEGVEAEIAGPCPTPAVGLRAIATGRPGIVVTGSHIPFDRNGVKFFTAHGEITKADESAITNFDAEDLLLDADTLAQATARWRKLLQTPSHETLSAYRARFLCAFDASSLSGLRIGVYQHSAVGRDFLADLLRDLGADVVPLSRSDTFVPIDTEVVLPADEAMAAQWAAEHQLNAVVSTDGDGDRPWICDERGNFLRGDVLGVIAARRLRADCVATPVSSNTALEKCGFFKKVARTKIGSPFVIEAMETLAAEPGLCVAGYEANGGFLTQTAAKLNGATLSPLPTRDSTLPILLALAVAKESKGPVSGLLNMLPPRRTASGSIKGIATAASAGFIAQLRADPEKVASFLAFTKSAPLNSDATDGLRIEVESGDIVHLRPSGNAPEFRCYVEADSQEKADRLLTDALRAIGDRFASAG